MSKPEQRFYDELTTSSGKARAGCKTIHKWISRQDQASWNTYSAAAELAVREMGISYTLYSEGENIDRAWPFDVVPRLIRNHQWKKVSEGIKQRAKALNLFIDDVYNEQAILRDEVVPAPLVLDSPNFRQQCVGMSPKHRAWATIIGMDLIRDELGHIYVLEDNMRIPSGVAYMIENRELTKRILPEIFENHSVLPVDDYISALYETLSSLSPSKPKTRPNIVVLTPGIYNSAYFEHAFLAQGMGSELVEGSDLFVKDDEVFMRSVAGPVKVDVIYRRVDEDYIDPEAFNKETMLGISGLMRAWKKGKVAIANAPGSGVADDKAIYAYVPDIITYYLNEKPILRNVETYQCWKPQELEYVLKNISKLVVKPVNQSGGYGILIGPQSSPLEQKRFSALLRENPRDYIAQPTLALSTIPTISNGNPAPRHLDLRPFVLSGHKTWVTSGGLTRVALKEGSLVVNSSQGGGSKDTWIVE